MPDSYKADSDGVYRTMAKNVDHLPDDMDMFTFMFDHFPSTRPDVRGTGLPLFIDEETGDKLTFEQTKERTELLSLGLHARVGVTWDTRVGIFSPNTMDYGVMIWATHRLGGIVSAANPAFGPSELSYQLDTSKASVLFLHDVSKQAGFEATDKAKIGRDHVVLVQDPAHVKEAAKANGGKVVRQIDGAWTLEGLIEEARDILRKEGNNKALQSCRRALKPGQARTKVAFLSFSSGTTGLPKGVAIQHYAPISNVLQHKAFNEIGDKLGDKRGRFRPGVDVLLGVLPMFHIYALVLGLHANFYSAIANVIIPKFRGIVPMLETAIKYRASLWYLVPPQVVLFCKDPKARSLHAKCREFVHMVMIGAAPLSDDLSRQFEQALPGVDWGQGYGMTETCTLTLMHPLNMKCVLGSAGRLVSNVEARIVTPEGKDCGLEEPGELWVRSPSNALGYSNNEQATREMWVDGGWVSHG
jgi:acyl-CoA synthetase (AMP-forming)/AMP-acid ligase II